MTKTIHISTVCIDGLHHQAFTVEAPVAYHKNGLYLIPIPALRTVEKRVFIAANYGYQVCLIDGSLFVYCHTQKLGKMFIARLLQIQNDWHGICRDNYTELPWETFNKVTQLRKELIDGKDYWLQ